MNKKKQPTQYTAELISTYQTGSTNPPKSHSGLVAFLLSLTIFICGLSTIFSLMRINLLQKLINQSEMQTCTLAFSQPENTAPVQASTNGLQIQGRSLDAFWQSYQNLPQGIYITESLGQPLRSGDIITSLDHTPVKDWQALNALLVEYTPGDAVPATIYRDGKLTDIVLIIYE